MLLKLSHLATEMLLTLHGYLEVSFRSNRPCWVVRDVINRGEGGLACSCSVVRSLGQEGLRRSRRSKWPQGLGCLGQEQNGLLRSREDREWAAGNPEGPAEFIEQLAPSQAAPTTTPGS